VFPHLSETAKKYKDKGLKVVGITSEPKEQVEGFVRQMRNVMQYTVACDSRQECEAKLSAPAGVHGIPHAFVVGADGLIKYSGHPMDPGFGKAVEKAVKDAAPVRMEPLPAITASREELMAMGVKDLKGILSARHVSLAGIIEKGDIVSTILEVCTGDVTFYAQNTGSPASAPSASAPVSDPPAPEVSSSKQKSQNFVCENGVCRIVPPGAKEPSAQQEETGEDVTHRDGLTSESELSSLKASELKAALKARGVSYSGLAEKSDLIAALKAALST